VTTQLHDAPAANGLEASLEPVRDALLADADADAERIVAEAERAADELVDEAERDADAAIENSRRHAEASRRARADQALARARREAHLAIQQARADLRRQLVDRVHTAAEGMRDDPRYPALLDHLEDLARSQLGDDAVIQRDPVPGGGIVATAGGRRVDYRLHVLADRALDAIADDVDVLWS
jgi:vacuolar-type H+-ATPase subunit E/Vma4